MGRAMDGVDRLGCALFVAGGVLGGVAILFTPWLVVHV